MSSNTWNTREKPRKRQWTLILKKPSMRQGMSRLWRLNEIRKSESEWNQRSNQENKKKKTTATIVTRYKLRKLYNQSHHNIINGTYPHQTGCHVLEPDTGTYNPDDPSCYAHQIERRQSQDQDVGFDLGLGRSECYPQH